MLPRRQFRDLIGYPLGAREGGARHVRSSPIGRTLFVALMAVALDYLSYHAFGCLIIANGFVFIVNFYCPSFLRYVVVVVVFVLFFFNSGHFFFLLCLATFVLFLFLFI